MQSIKWLSIMVLISACAIVNDDLSHLNCSAFADTFFRKPVTSQADEFIEQDVETQYAIYICGCQTREPPSIHLAVPFAKKGREAAGLLKEKLSHSRSDATTRDILFVFEQMAIQKSYDVAGDRDLMKVMDAAVNRTKDPFWKKQNEQVYHEIVRSR